MRFSTAAILSVVLIGGMFIYPAAVLAIFLPTSNQGLTTPLPVYEQILFEVAAFFLTWRFFLALPIIGVLFTIAGFTYPKPAPAAPSSTPRVK